jgi:hypothetical protein
LFEQALKIDPNESDALASLALAYGRSKMWRWYGIAMKTYLRMSGEWFVGTAVILIALILFLLPAFAQPAAESATRDEWLATSAETS